MKEKSKSGISYSKTRKKYIVSYHTQDKETGEKKRIRKSFNTEDEAKQFLEEMEYKKGNSIFIKNNGIPLNELMKFLTERKLKTNRLSEQHYNKVMKLISNIEQSEVGKKEISDITSEELQEYFNSLIYYSNSYMQKHIIQFSQAFKYAHNKGYIKLNPMIDTYKPKSSVRDKVIRAMELEEQKELTDYLKSKTIEQEPYKNVFLIQMYAGLRVGEALALQASDIDLKHNLIHVRRTLRRNAEDKIAMGDSTKTYSGIRNIPIQDIILNEIKEQLEVSKNNFDNQLFLSSNGTYADPRGVNNILKRILMQNFNIKDITTHSLRHTFGTRCIESGMAPVVVQRLMGHKDISVTLNTYTSVLNRFKESELEKLNGYYYENNLTSKSHRDAREDEER